MIQREPTLGMRHIALWISHFDACEDFYVRLLGLTVEWRPDNDNVYLTSGNDNIALHRAKSDFVPVPKMQRLDHFGFILKTPEQVDIWYEYFVSEGVKIHCEPRTHRDGARSFYCCDPDGNTIQMIYHPPIAL